MISFDFYPTQPAKLRGILKNYTELPTLATTPDIFEMMNDVPIKEISKNLDEASKGINKLVNSSGISESFFDLQNTLQETKGAMHSISLLAQYLQEHPESLLKGKAGQ